MVGCVYDKHGIYRYIFIHIYRTLPLCWSSHARAHAQAHRRKTCDRGTVRSYAHERTVVKHATRQIRRACAQCRYAIFCVSRTGSTARRPRKYDNIFVHVSTVRLFCPHYFHVANTRAPAVEGRGGGECPPHATRSVCIEYFHENKNKKE